jgi:murein DD-endopeptidase MepM/ murein hydrolase activator NlpD
MAGKKKNSKVKLSAPNGETFETKVQNKSSKSEEISRRANQEFFSLHEKEDEKESEYASKREETRASYKHRHYQSRQRDKDNLALPDGEFTKKTSFIQEAGKDVSGNKKIDRLEKKVQKSAEKTEKARKRLPQQKEYNLVRHFDEKTGRISYELKTRKKLKKPRRRNPVKTVSQKAVMNGKEFVHQKISEHEKENSGVEAAHKTEQTVENVAWRAIQHKPDKYALRRGRVAALEKKQFKAETNFLYKKFLEDNPEINKKVFQKNIQKRRIKREYSKALSKGTRAKQAAEYAQKVAQTTTNIARKIQEFFSKHLGVIITVGLFGIFFMLIAAGVSSCSAVFSGGISNVMAGCYQSMPSQLDASDEAMTSREMNLQNTIDSIETDYPEYDEYNYNLEEIGHNPFTLINYLSAVYVDINAGSVDGEIESLFDEMYELTLSPREETRTRTVTKTRTVINKETGKEEEEEYEDEEEYTVKILDVELARRSLEEIVAEKLTGNDDASTLFAIYQETNGALQQFSTPLDIDWYSMISSYYGYRKNPLTGDNQFHRGVDIAVVEGTEVYAAQDGTVTTAEYDENYGNYVVITDAQGYVTKYAHLESLNVSTGQTVKHGAIIGKTGNTGASTGSHLHIECMYNGEYYNPLFYFENGNGSIYGTTDPLGYGSGDAAELIAEAERYLGYPYVWGGSNPTTSFDCSGFVCYVLTNSGYYDMPRTTAQGIYNQCQHISASEAKAGDIIFFTGTYSSGNPVTHVGIYAGNGMMIHCGDPIKYSSINTPYWQSHFYAFGRLSPSE